MGSVKDIRIDEEATEDEVGKAVFEFSDRYSVFDWGEMPNKIPGKGKALAVMGAYNFEFLQKNGIKTHYNGLMKNNEVKKVSELEKPSNKMTVDLAYKPKVEYRKGEYEYEDLKDKNNFLIPLEVIFRNTIPLGSSFRRRNSPKEVGMDQNEWPDEKVKVEDPIIEFSTKLEEKDRYLDPEEAIKISNLSENEFEDLKLKAKKINEIITEKAEENGFNHEDGKVEFIYSDGEVILADVVGTFDENRFSYSGQQISKEFLRKWYKENNSAWYEEINRAKKEAKDKGTDDWKSLCRMNPKPLDSEILKIAELLYKSGANKWTENNFFDVSSLDSVVNKMEKIKR